jgi:hypothetical protein
MGGGLFWLNREEGWCCIFNAFALAGQALPPTGCAVVDHLRIDGVILNGTESISA